MNTIIIPQQYRGWDLFESHFGDYESAIVYRYAQEPVWVVVQELAGGRLCFTTVFSAEYTGLPLHIELDVFLLLSKLRTITGWPLHEIDNVQIGGAKEVYRHAFGE